MALSVIYALLICEMNFVVFCTADMFSIRKYSGRFTIGIYSVWTVATALASVFYAFSPYFSKNDWSPVLFAAAAVFACILPVLLMYKDNFAQTLTICFVCAIYGFLCFSISLQISFLIAENSQELFTLSQLIFQSVIIAVTLVLYLFFIKNVIFYSLSRLSLSLFVYMLVTNFLGFIAVVVNCISFIAPHLRHMSLASTLLVTATVISNFMLILQVSKRSKNIEGLSRIVYTDALTGIKNRTALKRDVDRLIASGTPFSLVFIDLDKFKRINDTYGHRTGDDYLKGFARGLEAVCHGKAEPYRQSGDEFICLCTKDAGQFKNELCSYVWTKQIPLKMFGGFSLGISVFPADGSTSELLLEKADSRMYHYKQNKKGDFGISI